MVPVIDRSEAGGVDRPRSRLLVDPEVNACLVAALEFESLERGLERLGAVALERSVDFRVVRPLLEGGHEVAAERAEGDRLAEDSEDRALSLGSIDGYNSPPERFVG